MNKTILSVIAVLIIVGGGVAALVMGSESGEKNNQTTAESTDATMEKNDSDSMEKTEEVMEKTVGEDAMMEKTESYVTLADYESDENSYKDQKKVYFFHASWCPICKSIDEDITSDPSQIPSDTTFIKTDFDTATELRQKYGVTTQYTFVQVDNDGNEVAQWSATNLDKAIAGIN
jgi:thiol-disulfide isomerase/thioredoxin